MFRTNGVSFINGGNVGIGITNPGFKLESNGGADDSVCFAGRSNGGNGNNARFTLKGFSHGGGAAYGGGFKIQTRDTVNIFHDRLTIDSSGKVGIGTTSPTSILHVSGSSSPTIKLQAIGSDATPALFVGDSNRSTDGQHLAEFRANWNGTSVARMVMQAGDDTTNKDNGQLVFETASAGSTTEALRIDESGNILCTRNGTQSSLAPFFLSVVGRNSATYGGGNNDTGVLRIEDKGSNNSYYHGIELRAKQGGDARIYAQDKGSDAVDLVFATDNSGIVERMRIASNGFVSNTYKPVKVVQNTNQDDTTGERFVIPLPNTSRMFKIAGTFSYSGNGSGIIYADFGDWSDGHTVDVEGVALSFKNGATENLNDLGNSRYQRMTPATFDAFNLECQYEIFITSKAFQNGNDTGNNAGGGRPGAFGHIRFTHSSIGASLTTFVFQDINATGTDRLQTFAWDIDGSSGSLGSGEHTYVLEEYPLT